ncbi:4-fold beta flower protein [Stenotrophomonas sp.]|uniref:4-fold beta flower protein n=1 Tax=Stenotrophomonas sp. TaxID=69392 RepID=UPI002FCA8116
MPTRAMRSLLIAALLLAPMAAQALQLSLYDRGGRAVAYIDTDSAMSIYLWQGQPVAYLDNQAIYGFNGRHLGWFIDGAFLDRDGHVVGVAEDVAFRSRRIEPLKGIQGLPPLKALPEPAPLPPWPSGLWSPMPLDAFLQMGKK